jgi:peptidylprolyl isomerase
MKNILLLFFFVCPSLVHAAKPVMADLIAASKASDWRSLDPEHTLYLTLASGRVVIELAPDFAPNHVANVKALAREKYWDGLAIVRVQDNYVVQWADPNAEKPELKRRVEKAKVTLPAEFDRKTDPKIPFTPLPDKDVYAPVTGFSNGFAAARDPKTGKTWLLHCYGTVGAGRDNSIDSGGGTELYAVIGHAPRQLDRNVTLLGRVLDGIERLSSLPRGSGKMGFYEKPEQNVIIQSVRVASDVPEKERAELEVLRTDTPLFAQLVESRRNRREEWFHSQAGHIDACNVPVPVRVKQVAKP